MNSQVEPGFRDTGDARRKLVSFASGVGFRMLVKQALAPGEPLQIDIGDGNLLMLARYRPSVELGRSTAVARFNDSQSEDARNLAEKAPEQVRAASHDSSAIPSAKRGRRGLALGLIAAAIGLSALGILWGGIRGNGHAGVSLLASARPAKKTTEDPARNSIEPSAPATSEAPLPDRKFADATSMPASSFKALPVPPIARVNAVPQRTAVAPLSGNDTGTALSAKSAGPKATVGLAAGSANSISIKASDRSWVMACADGVKVFGKLFSKGDVGEVHFSREATVRAGNANAIELAIGNQSITSLDSWVKMRTIKATPAGYEFIKAPPTSNCAETTPTN